MVPRSCEPPPMANCGSFRLRSFPRRRPWIVSPPGAGRPGGWNRHSVRDQTIEPKQVIGSTRFWRIDWHNRKLKIGCTWLSASWQRTFANTEAKFLMLCFAFERLNCTGSSSPRTKSTKNRAPPSFALGRSRKESFAMISSCPMGESEIPSGSASSMRSGRRSGAGWRKS